MARKNPVGKLAETALSTLKDPKAAAGKVVEQAKGTVALGKMAAETGVSMVGSVAGSVVGKAVGRGGRHETYAPRGQAPVKVAEKAPTSEPTTGPTTGPITGPTTGRTTGPTPPDLRAVPEVNEPAPTQSAGTKLADSPKKHGDVLQAPTARRTAQAKKAPSAKKAAPKKSPAKKAAPKSAAPKKTAATPADVAEVVEAAVAEDPRKTAAQPAEKAATKSTAKKGSAKKAPAKSSPGGRLPVKKAQPKPTKEQPRTAAELAANEGDDVHTPSGIPAVSEGKNPSTDDTTLTQPGTERLVDPATAKRVAAESETLRRAAENNPE